MSSTEPTVTSMWAELFGRPVTMDRLKEYATQHKAVIDALRARREARVLFAREVVADGATDGVARVGMDNAEQELAAALEKLEALL